jgi:Ca2+-binding EF-hand superfamily protein
MANRYAACDSPINKKQMKPQFDMSSLTGILEDGGDPLSSLFESDMDMAPAVLELRTLFNLIDTNSKGYLNEENMESLFSIVGYGRGKGGAFLISGIFDKIGGAQKQPSQTRTMSFQNFLTALHSEINRKMEYSMELVLQAFDFFSADNNISLSEDEVTMKRGGEQGIIQREEVINILMHHVHQHEETDRQVNYGEKWTHKEALSHLECIGWITNKIQYDKIVRDTFRLWQCQTLHNFVSSHE